ncbi:MAG: hypothetical protein GKC10_04715 [Methanosarcinales archaeon]|nr:hypothetical protein [Methanosarcinales archaeon]
MISFPSLAAAARANTERMSPPLCSGRRPPRTLIAEPSIGPLPWRLDLAAGKEGGWILACSPRDTRM